MTNRLTAHSSLPIASALAVSALFACTASGSAIDATGDPSNNRQPAASTEPTVPEAAATAASGSPRGGETSGASETAGGRVHGTTPEGEVFWTAFNAGRYEDLPAVQKSLDAATTRLPNDGYLRRLLGVSYFWQAAESTRDGAGGPLRNAVSAFSSIRNLEKAKEIAPKDPWVSCFLGLMRYEVGGMLGGAAKKAEALAEFDRGIAMYPQFTTYCRALARSAAPRGSEEFAEGVRDFWRVIEMCDPTVTPEHPEVSDPSRMGSCTQRTRVPHGYNGFWLTAGDVLTKAGNLVVGRAFYENAKKMNFDTWGQRDVLLERIARQAENAALYADGSAGNDPSLAFHSAHSCVMCHAR